MFSFFCGLSWIHDQRRVLVKLEFANLEGTPRLSHTSKSNNGVTF